MKTKDYQPKTNSYQMRIKNSKLKIKTFYQNFLKHNHRSRDSTNPTSNINNKHPY